MDASSYVRLLRSDEVRVTRALLTTLATLWMLSMIAPAIVGWFALVPGHAASLHHYLWTFVTAALVETSFTMGVVNLVVIAIVAPPVERALTSAVFIRLLVVTNVAVFFSTFMFMIFCYAVTELEFFLWSKVCGASGISAALGVAIKQRWGDRPIIPQLPLLRIAHLPVAVCVLAVVLWFVGRLGGKESPLVVFGTFYAWFYLRFYAVDADTKVVGDLREEFAFATLFPDLPFIRPLIRLISTMLYQTLIRLGCFQDSLRSRQTNQNGSRAAGSPTTTGDIESAHATITASPDHGFAFRTVDANAERRRALAIRAINEKLAELARDGNQSTEANGATAALPSAAEIDALANQPIDAPLPAIRA